MNNLLRNRFKVNIGFLNRAKASFYKTIDVTSKVYSCSMSMNKLVKNKHECSLIINYYTQLLTLFSTLWWILSTKQFIRYTKNKYISLIHCIPICNHWQDYYDILELSILNGSTLIISIERYYIKK